MLSQLKKRILVRQKLPDTGYQDDHERSRESETEVRASHGRETTQHGA